MQKMSMGSFRSRSSGKSIQNIIEDLNSQLPRHRDMVFVMSIQSDMSRKSRGSDLIENLDRMYQERRLSAKRSSDMQIESERGGSFGTNQGQQAFLGIPKPSFETLQRQYHSCDCYRGCQGTKCNCFFFSNEPCIPNKCCKGCIELKMVSMGSAYTKLQNILNSEPVQPANIVNNQRPSIELFTLPQSQPQATQAPNIPTIMEVEDSSQYTESQMSCACKKTNCLKMYCCCFAKGGFCGSRCQCEDCHNKNDSNARRQLNLIVEASKDEDKGCHCKKTKCQKKYCKCYASGEKCSKFCSCQNCNNMNQQLRLLRKKQSENHPQPQPQMIPQPCQELPKDIVFDMPDFSKLSLN